MKKKIIFVGIGVLLIIAAVALLISIPKWSEKSFEAVVQETVTMPDGEIRLIVEPHNGNLCRPFELPAYRGENKVSRYERKNNIRRGLAAGI